MQRAIPWIVALIPAAVFLVFLPAKFSGAAETQHIFSTVGTWFGSIGLGALLGSGVLTGALFFHLFTPLGVAVKFPGNEGGDPTLFVLAVLSWLCCLAILVRTQLARRTVA